MKKCSTCKILKENHDFRKNSSTKTGLRSRCRDCEKITIEKRICLPQEYISEGDFYRIEIISERYGKIYTSIDTEDKMRVSMLRWHVCKDNKTGDFYVVANIKKSDGKYTLISLHRFLMKASKGDLVDHKNHDTLDNRKQNLRICNSSQNQGNSRKKSNAKTSKHKGVIWHKRDKIFTSKISINGCAKHLGSFKTEREAAEAYNNAAIEYFGEFALLNILD